LIALSIGLTVAGAIGLAVSVNHLRFARRVASETRKMWASQHGARPIDWARIEQLPAPVRAYLAKALGTRTNAVQAVRFRHGGRFRTKLDGPWQLIRGEQYEAADPPGFLWWGRLRAAPGLWVDARDQCINGNGSMLVSFESSFTLADRSGPEMDQGSLLRLLSELVLFPTSFLDDRYLTWASFDAQQVRATLRVNGREVTGVFRFGGDALPEGFFAERYFDTGTGRPELRPWSGSYTDYRKVDGMLIPHHFIGYWHVDGERVPYVDFELDPPEYDVAAPF
jgi:hypothetical protein